MKAESNSIHWLERWYKFNCNGDWEHYYGVSMISLDNTGWQITIDLKNTKGEKLKKDYQFLRLMKMIGMAINLKKENLLPLATH